MVDRALVDANVCRIFWLALPPLKAAARFAAARTALRARVANPEQCAFALSVPHANHPLACAAVFPAHFSWPAQAIPAAALAPWAPDTVTWCADANPSFAISTRGESITLDAQSDTSQCPEAILSLVANGAKRFTIVGGQNVDVAALSAQLGIPVDTAHNTDIHASSIQFSAAQRFSPTDGVTSRHPAATLAGTVALIAGIAHAGFAGLDFNRARLARMEEFDRVNAMAAARAQTPQSWRTFVKKTHPNASRERASMLIEVALPALGTSAVRLKSMAIQGGALTLEWSAISPAELSAFREMIEENGAGVVAAGTKARVVWP